MRLIEQFKEIIKPVVTREKKEALVPNPHSSEQGVDVEKDNDVHYTPPGQWPTRGPKPSKLAILTYYFSLIMCIFGVLVMAKGMYIPREEKMEVLMMSSALIATGFVALIITNFLNEREHQRFVNYLQMKIEELMNENKGKGPRSIDS